LKRITSIKEHFIHKLSTGKLQHVVGKIKNNTTYCVEMLECRHYM